jgi:hypothetical protein
VYNAVFALYGGTGKMLEYGMPLSGLYRSPFPISGDPRPSPGDEDEPSVQTAPVWLTVVENGSFWPLRVVDGPPDVRAQARDFALASREPPPFEPDASRHRPLAP